MTRWVLVVAAVVVLMLAMAGGAGATVGEASGAVITYYPGGYYFDIKETYFANIGTYTGHVQFIYNCTYYASRDGILVGLKLYNKDLQCYFSTTDGTTHKTAEGSCMRYGSIGVGTPWIEMHTYQSGSPSGTGYYYYTYYWIYDETNYTVSGDTCGVSSAALYFLTPSSTYAYVQSAAITDSYSFDIMDHTSYRLVFSDGAYYDFTCTGNEVFDYDACLYVYGYTCGIDSIRLYVDDGGSWVVDEVESQFGGYANYEIRIEDGKSYLISFADCGFVCHNQTFACTGGDVHIDYDRCEYIPPPSPWEDPIIIYLWAGYDYNIVVFRDEHGNFIENSQLAIYDKTDGKYLQKWTDTKDGYALLGARFATDHDVLLTLRTFDGVFTLDTVYPANGSALVGEEDITTTNWTIPIWYNVDIYPVDQAAVPLFDVFCGLSEYTPLNPQAFWGYSMGGSQYVPITNCSGFAMCDLIAEKGGYRSYNVTALNWTSRSAMVKDYRHAAVLAKE